MKIIITESRLDRLAINWLNDNFGDLEPFESDIHPNHIFYRKGDEIIFEYNKNNGIVYVDYDEIWLFFESYFSMKDNQIQYLIKIWIEERYNLEITTTEWQVQSYWFMVD
jgi:hypothetical protein